MCLLQSSPSPFLKYSLSLNPELRDSLDCLASELGRSVLSTPPPPTTGTAHAQLALHVFAGDPNSGPPTCAGSAVTTEPFLQPPEDSFLGA